MVYIKFGISGIQDFIFNVSSKGAAKSLRCRSFFIEVSTKWVEQKLLEIFPEALRIYNGGGNFILRLNNEKFEAEKYSQVINEIKEQLNKYNLVIVNAFYYSESDNFGETLKSLNYKAGLSKFEPVQDKNFYIAKNDEIKLRYEKIVNLNNSLINAMSYNIKLDDSKEICDLLTFHEDDKGKYKIIQNVPKWNSLLINLNIDFINQLDREEAINELPKSGESISFQFFSEFAKRRSGTAKVGVLKLDIDNFGKILQDIKEVKQYKALSEKVTKFFEVEVLNLMTKKYHYSKIIQKGENGKTIKINEEIYKDNIYTVFLGGDDCFLIGAWDILLEFISELKAKFDSFSKLALEELVFLKQPLTFSASYIIIDSHFPVIKFSEIAEDDLHKAKIKNKSRKNMLSLFNEILPFEDLPEIITLKNKFNRMILEDGIEKGIIQKFVNLFTKAENIYWQKCGKPFNPAILWRFGYIMRDIRNKNDYQVEFFGPNKIYDKYIKDSFKKSDMKHRYIQIGARITEFLTKLN